MLGDANHIAGMQGLGALCLPASAAIVDGASTFGEGFSHGGAATDQAGTVCLTFTTGALIAHQFVVEHAADKHQQ